MTVSEKQSAPRIGTLTLSALETKELRKRLRRLSSAVSLDAILDSTIHQDLFEVLPWLPGGAFDLVFVDPPYNLTKQLHENVFRKTDLDEYEGWLEDWLPGMKRLLSPNGSIHVCGDWRCSTAIHRVLS